MTINTEKITSGEFYVGGILLITLFIFFIIPAAWKKTKDLKNTLRDMLGINSIESRMNQIEELLKKTNEKLDNFTATESEIIKTLEKCHGKINKDTK